MSAQASAAAPRGVVILGAPRSGTTLLRRLLGAHPSFASPPETYLLSAAARFLHEERFAQGLPIGVLTGLSYAGFEDQEVLARLRAFCFAFFEDYAAREHKPRWVEKTAFDAFYVPRLRRLLGGHVRFVVLHRHGLDVATSLMELVDKTGGYVSELHAYLRRHPQPLEAMAHAWVDVVGELERLVDEDPLAMRTSYERLIAEPAAVLGEILAFVGEPTPSAEGEGSIDAWLARALGGADQVGFGDWKTYAKSTLDPSSIDRWKALPADRIRMLAELCNPTLARLGYEEVPTRAEDVEQARRRYELGLLVNRMKR